MKPDIGGELLPAEFGRDPNADDDCFAAKNCRKFLLMAGGFFLWRRRMLSGQGTEDIGKLLTSAIIPVILLNSLWGEKTAEKTALLL